MTGSLEHCLGVHPHWPILQCRGWGLRRGLLKQAALLAVMGRDAGREVTAFLEGLELRIAWKCTCKAMTAAEGVHTS